MSEKWTRRKTDRREEKEIGSTSSLVPPSPFLPPPSLVLGDAHMPPGGRGSRPCHTRGEGEGVVRVAAISVSVGLIYRLFSFGRSYPSISDQWPRFARDLQFLARPCYACKWAESSGCLVMGLKPFHFLELSFTLAHIFANTIFTAVFKPLVHFQFILWTGSENDFYQQFVYEATVKIINNALKNGGQNGVGKNNFYIVVLWIELFGYREYMC